jgi:hypothetical protein
MIILHIDLEAMEKESVVAIFEVLALFFFFLLGRLRKTRCRFLELDIAREDISLVYPFALTLL